MSNSRFHQPNATKFGYKSLQPNRLNFNSDVSTTTAEFKEEPPTYNLSENINRIINEPLMEQTPTPVWELLNISKEAYLARCEMMFNENPVLFNEFKNEEEEPEIFKEDIVIDPPTPVGDPVNSSAPDISYDEIYENVEDDELIFDAPKLKKKRSYLSKITDFTPTYRKKKTK